MPDPTRPVLWDVHRMPGIGITGRHHIDVAGEKKVRGNKFSSAKWKERLSDILASEYDDFPDPNPIPFGVVPTQRLPLSSIQPPQFNGNFPVTPQPNGNQLPTQGTQPMSFMSYLKRPQQAPQTQGPMMSEFM